MASSKSNFNIVSHYNKLITTDESLTPPIAAIESLIAVLASTPATTISETLSLLQEASTTLRNSVSNPMPLAAGTDLFQRYVVATLQRPGALGPGGDFNLLRNHLISNSRLFVARAKEARSKIAEHALPFVQSSSRSNRRPEKTKTVITYGPSRTVSALLQLAASMPSPNLNVIYITPSFPPHSPSATQLSQQISHLRNLQILVATVPSEAAAYTLSTLPHTTSNALIIVGASSVLENGGVVSLMGTYQLALLAKALNKKFYVACESYKVVRMYLLGQGDLQQKEVATFEADDEADGKTSKQIDDQQMGLDITPPELITALLTENGVMTPNAVSEELIKLWF